MPKEIGGGYNDLNTNKEKPEYESHEKMTEEKFKEIIESRLGNPERIIELWVKNLKNSLGNISEKINDEYKTTINNGEEFDSKLLEKDGTIRMNAFKKGEGGCYKSEGEELTKDKKRIGELEKKWEEEWREEGKGKEGRNWKQEKEKNFGELWEKAKTVVLNKIIGKEFIVVRASKHDDYENGVDNIIVDKETGNVVCAFDEVSTERGTEKEAKKFEKIEEKNGKGGATIKYGITVNEEKKIIKKEIENIPVFCLRLSGGDLIKLLHEMNHESEEPSEIELGVFDDLIDSLEEQVRELKDKDIPEDENKEAVEMMMNNLKGFETSLEKMKELRDGFNADE